MAKEGQFQISEIPAADRIRNRMNDSEKVLRKTGEIIQESMFNPLSDYSKFERQMKLAVCAKDNSLSSKDQKNRLSHSGVRAYSRIQYMHRMAIDLNTAVDENLPLSISIPFTDKHKQFERFDTTRGYFGAGNCISQDAYIEGEEQGLSSFLSLISGKVSLSVFREDFIAQEWEGEYVKGGWEYTLPTRFEGVNVSYFYPQNDEKPSVELIINPIY
jgi:hypothetical protein